MVVLIDRAARAVEGRREKMCKCGFFKEMTRWTSVRTIVSLYSRGRGGLVRSTLLCEEKGRHGDSMEEMDVAAVGVRGRGRWEPRSTSRPAFMVSKAADAAV